MIALRRKSSIAAFTLMEVMLAAVILAGGLVIVLAATTAASKTVETVSNRRCAVQLAQQLYHRCDTGELAIGASGTRVLKNTEFSWRISQTASRDRGAIISCVVSWSDLSATHSVNVDGLVIVQGAAP